MCKICPIKLLIKNVIDSGLTYKLYYWTLQLFGAMDVCTVIGQLRVDKYDRHAIWISYLLEEKLSYPDVEARANYNQLRKK